MANLILCIIATVWSPDDDPLWPATSGKIQYAIET